MGLEAGFWPSTAVLFPPCLNPSFWLVLPSSPRQALPVDYKMGNREMAPGSESSSWHWCKRRAVMLLTPLSLPPCSSCARTTHAHTQIMHTLIHSVTLYLSLSCQMPNSQRGVRFLHSHRGYVWHNTHTNMDTHIEKRLKMSTFHKGKKEGIPQRSKYLSKCLVKFIIYIWYGFIW